MKFRDVVVGSLAVIAAVAMTSSVASATPNLIANGDFTAGFTGFTTQYQFIQNPGSTSLEPEGTITIANNPNDVHPSWVNLSTSFPLLIVNGATQPVAGSNPPVLPTIWEETDITTAVGGTYDFSASVMDICCNSSFGANSNAPSDIQFWVAVNGGSFMKLANYDTTPSAVAQGGDEGILETIDGTFSSTVGGSFDIKATNSAEEPGGNDFAITNLKVTAVPEPLTLSLFGAGLAGAAVLRRRKKKQIA